VTIETSGARPGYIPAIDGLRAIAIASVILYHFWPKLLPGGFTGVDIFFAISGFVVTRSMIAHDSGGLGARLGYFYARRLMRIMPALIVMLLATALAASFFIPSTAPALALTGELAFAGASNILLAFDTAGYFGPTAAYNPFTHSWSLGVEEQFYLIAPFIVLGLRRRAVPVVAALTLASLAAVIILARPAPTLAFYLIVARFWELGVGMLLCLTAERWQPRLAAVRAAPLVSAAGAVLLASAVAMPLTLLPAPFAMIAAVAGTTALIAAVTAQPGGLAARILALRPMVAVGLLSYSLYLWHWPVLVLFRWTLGAATLPLQLLALAITGALAFASYRWIEAPLRTSPRIAALPRGRVVLGMIAVLAVSALATLVLFHLRDRITLSVTRDHFRWDASETRSLDPAHTHCRVRLESHGYGVFDAVPEACTMPRTRFALYAVGDSHNAAYAPAYRQLAADLGVAVHSRSGFGCPVPRIGGGSNAGRCAQSVDAVLAELERNVRPGDVIFLPGLRQVRYANPLEREGWRPSPVTSAAMAEARAVVARLTKTGAHIVIEAPKPLFRSPAYRCADWFNRRNPACAGGLTMERAELEANRAPVLAAMQRLAAEQPALTVWDPFPLLCPGATCEAMPGGLPLYFDGDHISGAGNDRLYPSLRAAILAAAGVSAR
jgi:peptidoglycan/LPS O-acetylase OafA/YrhL